jgi:hypothetical protein
MNQPAASRNVFRTGLRSVTRQPLFSRRAQQDCRACGHQAGQHAGFPDPALAEQLGRIHGGCLDCETCADE